MVGTRRRLLALTTLAAAAAFLVASCGGRESAELGEFTLTDLGGDERPRDVRSRSDVGAGGADDAVGARDTRPVPDAPSPPPDVGPAPDTGVSLAPDCPPTGHDWSVWFSKPVKTAAAPGGPAACGEVRLDRTLAWFLRGARTSIDLAFYGLDAKEVADALLDAHTAGVAVRVVVDDENAAADPDGRVAALREAGVPVRDDDDPDRLMHHKFAVVDDARVWLGSANANTYDGVANANNALAIPSSALAAHYTAELDRLWAGGAHDDKGAPRTLTIDGGAATLYFSPDAAGRLEDELIRLIRGADHEIFVGMFAFTRQRIADALEDRCGQAAVFVVLDEQSFSDRATVSLDLCASGAFVADDVQPTGGLDWPLTLHHKYMVVDGRHPDSDPTVVTGSMNWSQNGLFHNDEATLVWRHADAAALFAQEFAARAEEAGATLPAP